MTGVARLLHHDGRESENRECNRSRKAEVHERNREPARDPDSAQSAAERIEQQGDEQRHEEEENHVTHRSRHDPHQHEQQREPDQLNPRGISIRVEAGAPGMRPIVPRPGVGTRYPSGSGAASKTEASHSIRASSGSSRSAHARGRCHDRRTVAG